MNELTLLEREILKSSHDDGMIPFPQGRFLEVERTFRTLENLARRGYVEYVRKTWYRAYWITEKGCGQLAAVAKINVRRRLSRPFTNGSSERHTEQNLICKFNSPA